VSKTLSVFAVAGITPIGDLLFAAALIAGGQYHRKVQSWDSLVSIEEDYV
jgi:hypothetical protein